MANRKYWPIWQITVSRLKEFVRAPGAVFWVYGFPIIMMLALGTAFRDNPQEHIAVDLVGGSTDAATAIEQKLAGDARFTIRRPAADEWEKRLQVLGVEPFVTDRRAFGVGQREILGFGIAARPHAPRQLIL